MLSYEKSTIGDRHPDSKFANELGALHKCGISFYIIYIYFLYIASKMQDLVMHIVYDLNIHILSHNIHEYSRVSQM